MQLTETMTRNILYNGLTALVLGMIMALLGFLRTLPSTMLPGYVQYSWHLDKLAVSIEIGITALLLYILVEQIRTVPLFLELYRFLSEESVKEGADGDGHSERLDGT